MPRFLIILIATICALHRAAALPVFETLADFTRPGANPLGPLVLGTDVNYYGTTSDGGVNGFGTIFKMTPAGVVTTLVSFTGTNGAARGELPEAGLVPGPAGVLYGATLSGGANDLGTIFKVTTAGVFTTLVEFTGTSGAAKGSVPGDLVLHTDGNFYGTTQSGGANDLGTAFKMTPSGVITTLVEFTGTSGLRKGSAPIGALAIIGSTLYGVTQTGGANGYGAIYHVSTTGASWTVMAEFTGINGGRRGSYPAAGLMLHPDGDFYGTTEFGGANNAGTVFRITTGNNYAVLREFASATGAQPAGALIFGPDAALYGTTAAGGTGNDGTVFCITTLGVHFLLADLDHDQGSTPRSGLIVGADGSFFGTTSAGGAGNKGSVFNLTFGGVFTHLADFTNAEGWSPIGAPAADVNGDLIFPARMGGAQGEGTLLRLTPAGALSVEAEFGGSVGENPAGALVRVGTDFFGVTENGGTQDRGTFFRHTPGVGTTLLTNFGVSAGTVAEGPLVVGADGNFYGVAEEGGTNGKGTIFKITPGGIRTRLVSFTGTTGSAPGDRPRAPLALARDGNFYGATEKGGANNQGRVFKLTPAGVFTKLVEFTASGPNTPLGGLAAGPDGNVYGTTVSGGAGAHGTIFRVTPAGALTVIAEFTGSGGARPGSEPEGPLRVALDGTLYGTTTHDGANDSGTIFRVLPGGAFETLAHFTGKTGAVRGSSASGGLDFAPDGWLYGVAPNGGTGGGGTAFRLKQLGPHAGTADATALTTSSLTINGRAQTGGVATTVSFEYGSTPALGGTTASSVVGPGGSPAAFSANFSGLSIGQTIYYRAKAVNADGTSFGVVRSIVVPSPFELWKLSELGDRYAPNLGDPDFDGASNLAEYGLLLNPSAPDAAALPVIAPRIYPQGTRLALIVSRDPARNDVSLIVQASASPAGPWTPIASSIHGAPFAGPGYVSGDAATPGVKAVEIRDIVNMNAAPQRFLRVLVAP